MTTIRWIAAGDWGMRWARPPVREVLRDPEVYVHHVGGNAWMDYAHAEKVFQDLNEYAIRVKGYSALDYDMLVHYHREADMLTIGEGRGEWRSAATLDRNEEGEAIVLCGNTHLREPLPIELTGIALAAKIGVEKGWVDRSAKLLGHRDNPAHPNATACPGKFLYPHLGDIETEWKQMLAGDGPHPKPPTPNPPAPYIDRQALENDMATFAAKLEDNGSWWVGDGRKRRWVDAHAGAMHAAGGVVDAKSAKLVHSFNHVQAVPLAYLDQYVGTE